MSRRVSAAMRRYCGVNSFTPVNGIKWKKQNFKAGWPREARVL
jgi:hypothetical protein